MATKYKKNSRGFYETRIWDGTYNEDGSQHRQRVASTKSSADLERKVQEFRENIKTASLTVESSMSFYDYAMSWLDIEKGSAEKNTQRMYRQTVKHFSCLSDIPVGQIRHSHLQLIINDHKEHPKTCKNIKSTFSQIVRAAIRDHLLPREAYQDIMEDIKLPHYVRPKKRALTPLEKEAVKNAHMDPRKQAFVSILFYCGLRRQEALALTPACFNWEEKTLSVEKVLIFDGNNSEIKDYPKSDHGFRSIPMPDALIEQIKPYVTGCEDTYLFHSSNTETMTETGYRRMWDSIITSLNVAAGYNPNAKKNRTVPPIQGLTAHIFRHNFCTELCYQIPAISTKMIAKLLGDDEHMVLDVYSHIMEEKENVADTLNRAFAPC